MCTCNGRGSGTDVTRTHRPDWYKWRCFHTSRFVWCSRAQCCSSCRHNLAHTGSCSHQLTSHSLRHFGMAPQWCIDRCIDSRYHSDSWNLGETSLSKYIIESVAQWKLQLRRHDGPARWSHDGLLFCARAMPRCCSVVVAGSIVLARDLFCDALVFNGTVLARPSFETGAQVACSR